MLPRIRAKCAALAETLSTVCDAISDINASAIINGFDKQRPGSKTCV